MISYKCHLVTRLKLGTPQVMTDACVAAAKAQKELPRIGSLQNAYR